ncbi:MAG: ROK family protein [Clostridia bacterium]|nr:ROK family protein [Clostridia bacterium]
MVSIGIDVGGTGLKAGAVSERGEILSKVSCPTLPERGFEAVVADMARLAVRAAEEAGAAMEEVRSVGIGIPGVHDPARNLVVRCVNLYWKDVPLIDEMHRYLSVPVYVDNDATVAGLAESVAGASRGMHSSVLITLGTGIGSAIIIDGRIYAGAHGCGGEMGHIITHAGGILCSCGHRGCWERYASASGLIRLGQEIAKRNPDGVIARKSGGNPEAIDARMVLDSAKEGDPDAMQAFETYTEELAIGLSSIVVALDPEMIVLGGGVAGAGEFLLQAVRKKIAEYAIFPDMPLPRIELAITGNDAGIIGAAHLGR